MKVFRINWVPCPRDTCAFQLDNFSVFISPACTYVIIVDTISFVRMITVLPTFLRLRSFVTLGHFNEYKMTMIEEYGREISA